MSIEDYFSDWQERTWTCRQCSWSGSGGEASSELFAELFELNCPKCGGRLALVLLPTHDAIRSAAAEGHLEAIGMMDQVAKADDFQADQQRSRLKLKQLRAVNGEKLEFSLATIETHDWMSPSHVLLLCNGTEIYRERSGFEHWEAVLEIGQAVMDQFGDHVAWFDPAEAGVSLLGDNIHAPAEIQDFLNRAGITPPTGPWASTT